MKKELQEQAEKILQEKISAKTQILESRSIGGGDINHASLLKTNSGNYFLKSNKRSLYPKMFEREAEGLQLIRSNTSLKVPDVIGFGETSEDAFLILEYLAPATAGLDYHRNLGKGLAELHRSTSDSFGLDTDNYIGSLHQSNSRHEDWIPFFIHERIEPMLRKARDAKAIDKELVRNFDRLFLRLESFFPEEKAALLHGDLWSGNVHNNGGPCLIDPAVYYGHREMDLAMTHLFGGFSSGFYEAYNSFFPLEPGWNKRLDICNLYPLLVHVNLFGGGYVQSIHRILKIF